MAGESIRLQQAFDSARIPLMVLKGIPVGQIAYGRLGLKQSWDIDLLVLPDDMARARGLLIELGYGSEFDERAFDRVAEVAQDVAFHHTERDMTVELHQRLNPTRGLLQGINARGPTQRVPLRGWNLATLADGPLFAYLCVHGAMHNWNRLKWLADFNAFVATRSDDEVREMALSAVKYGAERSASVALGLCRTLFGTAVSEDVSRTLENSAITRALTANVLAGWNSGGGVAEPRSYSLAWLRERAARALLRPGWRHVADEVMSYWNGPADRAAIALPRRLSFLYHVLRVPLWLGRHAGALGSRQSHTRVEAGRSPPHRRA
jgi:hypothetical protein